MSQRGIKLKDRLLILGIGNVLMGDEGVGVHAVRRLQKDCWPEGVDVLDGGTGGFHLMGHLEDHPRVVMIDATMDGQPAGTVRVIQPKFAKDFPTALSAHDIGLKDMIGSMALLDRMPAIDLITISIDKIQAMTLDLSPEVTAAIPEVEARVRELVAAGRDST